MIDFDEKRQTVVFILSYLQSNDGDPFNLTDSTIATIEAIADSKIGNRQLEIARNDLNESLSGFPDSWRSRFSDALTSRCPRSAKWFFGT